MSARCTRGSSPTSASARANVARTPVAPTNLAYTSYLIATAYGGSFAELLGAVRGLWQRANQIVSPMSCPLKPCHSQAPNDIV